MEPHRPPSRRGRPPRSLDLTSAQTAFRADGRVRFPFFAFENTSSNRLELSLSVWFRTDELIARNWIER